MPYIVIDGQRVPTPELHPDAAEARRDLAELFAAGHVNYFQPKELGPWYPEDVSDVIPVLLLADDIRAVFGSSVKIISALRPLAQNQGKGQSPKSQHLWGRALDLRAINGDHAGLFAAAMHVVSSRTRGRGASDNRRYGVGRYDTFVHVDVSTPALDGGRTRDSYWDSRRGAA